MTCYFKIGKAIREDPIARQYQSWFGTADRWRAGEIVKRGHEAAAHGRTWENSYALDAHKAAIVVALHILYSRISNYDFPHIDHGILFRLRITDRYFKRYARSLLV
jgi:hypothetical protein